MVASPNLDYRALLKVLTGFSLRRFGIGCSKIVAGHSCAA